MTSIVSPDPPVLSPSVFSRCPYAFLRRQRHCPIYHHCPPQMSLTSCREMEGNLGTFPSNRKGKPPVANASADYLKQISQLTNAAQNGGKGPLSDPFDAGYEKW